MKPGLHEAVMDRDRRCVLSFLEEGHVCRTRFGTEHPADAVHLLTLEHVKPQLAMGIAKFDDIDWLVAMCGAGNARPPTKVQRALIRQYLAVWAMFRMVFRGDQWWPYLTTGAPIFDGRTALSLIVAGDSERVLATLDQLASGAFV